MSIRNYIEFSEDDKRTINQLLEEGTDIIDILRASNAMKSYKRVNTQSAWVQLNSKISDKKLKSYIPVAIAASLILLFAAIFMLKNTSEITYSTGEMASHIILDDGSEIILEPHGEIKVSKDYNKVNRAIELKGDSISDYVRIDGTKGGYQTYAKVYGRKGEKCFNCGGIIKYVKINQRGTFYCPECQK